MVYSDLSYAHKRLRDTLGDERVSTSETEKLVYGHDFAPIPKQAGMQFNMKPDIITLPKSTQEVVRILKLGEELSIPVVPRGGGTSLHGGSVPNVGGILMATNLMGKVGEPDKERLFVTVQAGATWHDISDSVDEKGFALPSVPILHRSSTVGGFLSNGGVGIGSYMYGPPSRWVRSLEVVLPGGEIIETGEGAFALGDCNYNLTSMFMGAEGTLGVITKATLQLVRKPQASNVSAYGFQTARELVAALRQLSKICVTPHHVGFVDEAHLTLQRGIGKSLPEWGGMIFLNFQGEKECVAAEERVASTVLTSAGGAAQDGEVANTLWRDRHEPYNARRLSGGLIVGEGLVPLSALDEVLKATAKAARRTKSEAAFHGFLVDRGSAYLAPYFLTNERLLRGQLGISFVEKYHTILNDHGGHPLGLGLLTTYNLEAMFGGVTGMMRAIKEAVDPNSIVNRGKLVGTMGRKPPLLPPELPAGLMRRGLRALGALRRLMPSDKYVTKVRRRL